jgi:hypothetical protein
LNPYHYRGYFHTFPGRTIKVYEKLGYIVCNDNGLEIGFEKIALYHLDGEYMHAARQLPNGRWTSKLGFLEDIEHDTLSGLEDGEYGVVKCVMKRKK